MLGTIIGDIAGSRFEFDSTNNYNFEMFTDKCDFTDDTICTMAIADAILSHKTYKECLLNWCRKYPNPKGGYGSEFNQWVFNADHKPYNSFGNGSAMRVSPIAWAFNTEEEILEHAKLTAECTHNHPEGIKGAQTVALAIFYARLMYSNGIEPTNTNIKEHILDKCVQFSGYDININKIYVQNKFDSTCQGTVPVALWIISRSDGFEDAIRNAVSLGADADTLGAIVGCIAEAIWGIYDNEMVQKAINYLPDDMQNVLEKFRDTYIIEPVSDEVKEAVRMWTSGLGDMNKVLRGENPLPEKSIVATAKSWKIYPMPKNHKTISTDIVIDCTMMDILRKGHIPDVMEDHWFMYCTKSHIRYYRSWTGYCVFDAHYRQKDDKFIIDTLAVNTEVFNKDYVRTDKDLFNQFCYLISAECSCNPDAAWKII